MRAWRTIDSDGVPAICIQNKRPLSISKGDALLLPCGKCLGCKLAHRQAWAFRCQLETQQHDATAFTTLTYSNENCPVTLDQRDLTLWLKRLRSRLKRSEANRTLRFFAAGEYGETTGRPHYHAILYGLSTNDADLVQDTWGLGFTETTLATAARIAYCAGYIQKKIGHNYWPETITNPHTGDTVAFQPPFIQMSRRPGIGGHARQFLHSWRLYAVTPDGHKLPVPRFLHQAWKDQATLTDEEKLETEKTAYRLTRHQEEQSIRHYNALRTIAEAQQRRSAETRRRV